MDKVIAIDQTPIGRTPRSNPATYTGAFAAIRELFSLVPEARARGYKAGRFSFNVKGGRCEACQGGGVRAVEMHLLPDVYVRCEACKGRRYNRETLEILYRGRTVADVLDMTVSEAQAALSAHPRLNRMLLTLMDVGLGYVRLGQSATTLSGGEAQRVKLARELGRRDTGRTLYILDEPTTGLHFDDVRNLLHVLGRLVDAGNTVIVIEHNLEVVKSADHVIDLGPEAGAGGGRVVAAARPRRSRGAPPATPASSCGRCSPACPRHDAPPRAPIPCWSGARSSPSWPTRPTWSAIRWGPCPAGPRASSRSTRQLGHARRTRLGGGLVADAVDGGRRGRSDHRGARRAASSCTRTSPSARPLILSCFDLGGRRNKIVYEDLNFPSVMYVYEAHRSAGGAHLHRPERRRHHRAPRPHAGGHRRGDAAGAVLPRRLQERLRAGRGRGRAPGARGGRAGGGGPLPVGGHGAGGRDGLGRGLRHRGRGQVALRGPGRRLSLRGAAAGTLPSSPGSRAGWPTSARSISSPGPSNTRRGPHASCTGRRPCPRSTPRGPATRSWSAIGVDAIRRKSERQVQLILDLAAERGIATRTPTSAGERGGMVILDLPHGQAVTRELLRREILVDFRPGRGDPHLPALLHERRGAPPRGGGDRGDPGFGGLPRARARRRHGLLSHAGVAGEPQPWLRARGPRATPRSTETHMPLNSNGYWRAHPWYRACNRAGPDLMAYRRTLKRGVGCTGIGLHSGRPVRLELKPAPAEHGIRFRRTDVGVEIPARSITSAGSITRRPEP